MEIMYSNNAQNKYFNNHNFIGLIGEAKDLNIIITDINHFKLKPNRKVKKIISNNEYLDMFNLRDDILKDKVKDLSEEEYKIIELIKVVSLNPNLIVLNNFDLGLNHKLKSKLSRFIKLVNASDKINFIIITNDLIFLNKNVKHILILKNKIIKYQGDILTAIKQGLIEKPPIIKFIDFANKENAGIDYTLDNKELLKAIYRSVF